MFSTLLGGVADDEVLAAADDGSGGLVLTGFTASVDFPTTSGAHDTSFGGGAGLFSMIIGGWVNGEMGSQPVTRAVTY